MAKSKIVLPRVFDNNEGKGKAENDIYLGLPKISYSQLGSWKDLKYRKDYFKKYFAGMGLPVVNSWRALGKQGILLRQ